ncbi:asparagine--tRNA ligase [Candidatus Micrarchaeota archaeon]|nr:MAG: asparagine--tRNA ligase [Candidatus Micrarchaeota archaeon]
MSGFRHIKEVMKDEYVGKSVKLRGWVYRQRSSAKVAFIVLRDVTGIIQCTVKAGHPDFKKAVDTSIESSVELEGKIVKDERAPGGYELAVDKYKIVHLAERFPIVKDQSVEFLMDVRHLALRSRRLTSILKIRSTVLYALHNYLRSEGYYEVEAPIISGASSEGGAEVFELNYFGKKAYLTQSWQFYAENMIHAFEKVYCMAPSFRAEKSHTYRHLTEYWHCEVEAAWADMEEMIRIAEGCVVSAAKSIPKQNADDLEVLGIDKGRFEKVKAPFPRITYKEAVDILNEKGVPIKYGYDFGAEHERKLTEAYDRPLIVTNYPSEIMAFYKAEDPEQPGTSKNFNVLAPKVGEIIDGSEREPDINKILAKLKKEGKNLEAVDWYLDGRRYGSVPHSGFGLGVERLIQWLLNLDHIRDTIAFPRFINRFTP